MPIRIPDNLPARHVLEGEGIFVMEENRALSQDIRPLHIVILNLMPDKVTTETQLLRTLSNTPIQIDIDLLRISTHESKHTSAEHMLKYYETFDEIKDRLAFCINNELTEKERHCLTLKISGASVKEISDIMSLSEKAVETALSRARKKLKSIY